MKQDINTVAIETWRKVEPHAKRIGAVVLEKILTAYYAMIDPATPMKAKWTLAGALAYVVLPLDVIPDFLPGGFVDDGAAIGAALYAVASVIKPEHGEQARAQMAAWGVTGEPTSAWHSADERPEDDLTAGE